jgi:hypothetical protein
MITQSEICKDLSQRCPDAAPILLDAVAHLAALVDDATTRKEQQTWDLETYAAFTGVLDRLTRGLWLLGPKRIGESRAEWIAQKGIMLSEKLLLQLAPEGCA